MVAATSAFALTAAALAAIVQAVGKQPSYGCLLGGGKSGAQISICPHQEYPFHLLCGPIGANEASDACIAQGWRLAVLNDSNKFGALWQIRNCTPANAWIDSFNGVLGEGCFQFRGDAPIIETDLPGRYCRDTQQAVLCEDVPVETITETDYVTTTTDYEIKTRTKYVEPTCPPRPCKPCKTHRRDSEFVILDEHVSCHQAECACKQLGMRLADLTIFNFLDASYELWHELGPSKHAWIRSWNGDKYEHDACLALWTGASGPNGAIARPRDCHARSPVICQHHQRPPCPCQPKEPECECFRPPHHHHHHHHHRHGDDEEYKGGQVESQQKAAKPQERNIFLQAEPLPIFANAQEKEEYEQKIVEIRKRQKEQGRIIREADAADKEDAQEYDAADEVDLVDGQKDKCIHGSGPCPHVCKHRTKNIRVVQYNATAYNADYICSRFGWTQLDYKDEQEKEVRYLKKKCGGFERGFWIRSYNKVDGGACMLIDGGYGVPVGWVISAYDCEALGYKYVLCQTCDRPVATTSGHHTGSITFTTYTRDATLTTTSYTRTVTTTVTLLQQ